MELNYKYNLHPSDWIIKFQSVVKESKFVFGGDIHSVQDLLLIFELKKRLKTQWGKRNFCEQWQYAIYRLGN